MKKVIGLLAVIVFMAAASNCFALTENKTFTLSASVPTVSSISITAYSVDVATGNASLMTGTALGFSPLTFDPLNSVWVANHFFYVNVETAGGVGTPATTLTFTQGLNPNGTGHGLGWKGAVTYTKVVAGVPTEITAHPKELFKDVSSDVVTAAQVSGGYFRAYLGLNTGGLGMPTGGEPFTSADVAGSYEGTLLVSATVN
jgi:hypothetical protein